jgi:hypothetical protein
MELEKYEKKDRKEKVTGRRECNRKKNAAERDDIKNNKTCKIVKKW